MTRAIRAENLANAESAPQILSGVSRISLALGEPERAKEEARQALKEAGITSESYSNHLTWTNHVDRFIAEEIDVDEFLRLAKPHGNTQSEAYLVIGTWHLARQNFEAARRVSTWPLSMDSHGSGAISSPMGYENA